jgi:hypothetical protein
MEQAQDEYKQTPEDDMCLYRFIARALDTYKPLVSENGYIILENNPLSFINQINENNNPAVSQKPLTRLCVFYTLVFNLSILYIGWKHETTDEEERNTINKLLERMPVLESELKKLTPLLSNKYAHIYDTCKRKCWIKNHFDDTNMMPIHPDDLPEGCGIDPKEWYKG